LKDLQGRRTDKNAQIAKGELLMETCPLSFLTPRKNGMRHSRLNDAVTMAALLFMMLDAVLDFTVEETEGGCRSDVAENCAMPQNPVIISLTS
jgi:hypothetical protein